MHPGRRVVRLMHEPTFGGVPGSGVRRSKRRTRLRVCFNNLRFRCVVTAMSCTKRAKTPASGAGMPSWWPDGLAPDDYLTQLDRQSCQRRRSRAPAVGRCWPRARTAGAPCERRCEETVPVERFPNRVSLKARSLPASRCLRGSWPERRRAAVVIAAHHFADASWCQAMQRHFEDIQRADRVITTCAHVGGGHDRQRVRL